MHLLLAFLAGLIVGGLAVAIFGRKAVAKVAGEIAVLTTALMRLENRLIRNKAISAVETVGQDVFKEVRNKL